MNRKVQSLFIGILLSAFSILSFLACAEFFIRYFHPEIIPFNEYDWSLRHAEYQLEKPKDVFRIVVLGDSFTYGQGVNREHTFSKQLEVMLNKSIENQRFEVINLGFCGLNTEREFEILVKRGINPVNGLPDPAYSGLSYSPDLVILEYTLNDSSRHARALEDVRVFDYTLENRITFRLNSGRYSLPIPEATDRFLTMNSKFYLFFIDRYNRLIRDSGLRNNTDEGDSIENRYSEDFIGWKTVKGYLLNFGYFSKKTNIPMVMVIFPQMTDFLNYPYKSIHTKVTSAATAGGISYLLDLLPAFAGTDFKKLSVSPVDGHPNSVAHTIAAKAIYEYLVQERLILIR